MSPSLSPPQWQVLHRKMFPTHQRPEREWTQRDIRPRGTTLLGVEVIDTEVLTTLRNTSLLQRISSTLQESFLLHIILGPLERPPIAGAKTCNHIYGGDPISPGPPVKGEDPHHQCSQTLHYSGDCTVPCSLSYSLLRSQNKSSGQQNMSRSDTHHFRVWSKETSPGIFTSFPSEKIQET